MFCNSAAFSRIILTLTIEAIVTMKMAVKMIAKKMIIWLKMVSFVNGPNDEHTDFCTMFIISVTYVLQPNIAYMTFLLQSNKKN